jgi:hypothetical protein
MKRTLISTALVTLLVAGAYGQQEVDTETIKQLVAQLSSGDWRVREKAQKQLVLVGKPAVPYLRPLAQDPVFEVRFRVKEILSHIRVVSPEDAAVIEKCLKEYDPGGDKDKTWRLTIKLRRLKNVRFHLIDRIVKAAAQEREKIASLLACVEYRVEGRRVDKDISCSTDILLSMARDKLLGSALRLRTLRALTLLKDRDGTAVLADILQRETGSLASRAAEALEAVRGEKPEKKDADKQREGLLSWWSKAARESEYEKAVEHLKRRKEFEEKEASEKISFLGVVKDASLPDGGGAHVERPWPDSGAMKAGVEAGDIIVEFDGWPVRNWGDMVHGIRRSRPGQKVLLKVLRGGREIELEAVLSKRPENQ